MVVNEKQWKICAFTANQTQCFSNNLKDYNYFSKMKWLDYKQQNVDHNVMYLL